MLERELIIIGGGPGGYFAAVHASHIGASVALIEQDKLGGACLNHGCIPTKALVRNIEVLHEVTSANDFGIDVGKNIKIDFQKVMARKRDIVSYLAHSVEELMKVNKISVHRGIGHIISPHLVRVNNEEIAAKRIIIATGSEWTPLPVPGANLKGVLSTNDVLELDEIPESMVVIGGGYVGIEFACIFGALGTTVTIVEKRPLLLEQIDEEIGRRLTHMLLRSGIKVKTGATVKEIIREEDYLKVVCEAHNVEQGVTAQLVLMATGRQPYTKGLCLSELGVKTNGQAIVVNDYLETTIKGIYAVGDVLGTNMLAHVASHEGMVAVENALGRHHQIDYTAVPTCIFTNPTIAGVGITEADAKDRAIPYKVSKFPFSACGRAIAMGKTAGLVKIICNAESGKLLGMHIIGPNADDLIAEGTLAIKLGATAKDIGHTMHAHPTLAEAIHEAAIGQLEGSIHHRRI